MQLGELNHGPARRLTNHIDMGQLSDSYTEHIHQQQGDTQSVWFAIGLQEASRISLALGGCIDRQVLPIPNAPGLPEIQFLKPRMPQATLQEVCRVLSVCRALLAPSSDEGTPAAQAWYRCYTEKGSEKPGTGAADISSFRQGVERSRRQIWPKQVTPRLSLKLGSLLLRTVVLSAAIVWLMIISRRQ